ncbi:alpha/beta hydrolase [Natrinema gelatinilyticum]|uniref:alpha/beta hydrolase n=1 Tax=Natrinema gelatinilyticum TaxID=2961571 RepID=UPI0020C4244A|nr:alpha/beta hydrolase [Natrinema gelatinilyticum]
MTQNTTKTAISFESGGIRCSADLYLPLEIHRRLPCIVMGHGFSGTKDLGLPAFAERFAAEGFAVLAFDYRHFGESGGEPRQVVDVERQRDDYRAAIRRARSLGMVDPDRVAIWGTSFAGGHVIAVAADDPKLAAVITQVPMLDAFRGRGSERAPVGVFVRMLLAGVYDAVRGKLGLSPYLVPVIGEPGGFAVITEPDAKPIAERLAADATTWRNEFAPCVVFDLPRYEVGTVERITAPILLCVAEEDQQVSPEFAVQVVEHARNSEIIRYPVGHFQVYVGEMREQVIEDQLAFLQRHLRNTHQTA